MASSRASAILASFPSSKRCYTHAALVIGVIDVVGRSLAVGRDEVAARLLGLKAKHPFAGRAWLTLDDVDHLGWLQAISFLIIHLRLEGIRKQRIPTAKTKADQARESGADATVRHS